MYQYPQINWALSLLNLIVIQAAGQGKEEDERRAISDQFE
jgi:hypothetical protein